jgi:type IX secretion system PorP/SprF family membrane protein
MGNKFEFTNFTFTPTALFKAISGSPLELDVNANFLLKDQLWLSGGYRSNNEIILAVGYVLFKNLKFGYSYDFPFFSSTNSFSGSHEVSLGYGISFYKKYSNKKRSILKRNKNFKRRVKF